MRFAIHDVESTISVKQEFESSEEFRIGQKVRIEGEVVIIKDINLYGGKSVKMAYAIEISRVTCVYGKRRKK